jgi:DNA-binding MarR family transcriptional regulator
VERGWVERQPHPRHANVQELYLTDSGRRELVSADRLLVDLDGHLRDSLGEEDYQRLRTLLGEFMTHLATWTPPEDTPA